MLGSNGITSKKSPRVVRGQLLLPTSGGSGGILVGGDCALYRRAANAWYIPDYLRFGEDNRLEFRANTLSIHSPAADNLRITSSAILHLAADTISVEEIIRHYGDSDTYIRYTTDSIQLYAGATECMQINATGIAFFTATPQAQQAHIIDADGNLADITTKFNTLLADLEGYGLLAAS